MSITVNGDQSVISISTEHMTYAIGIYKGYVDNIYWGKKVSHIEDLPADDFIRNINHTYILKGKLKEEYPCFGGKFYSHENLKVTFADHVRDTVLKFHRYQISSDEHTLSIVLRDEVYPLEVELIYKTYEGLDLIDRHSIIRNLGDASMTLETFGSATYYPPYADRQRLTYMGSGWGHEYEKQQCELGQSTVLLESRSGLSNTKNFPWFAIDDGTATEHRGEVWFGTLQWSGNWQIAIEKDDMRQTRVTGGISNFDCEWNLKLGESFETPVFTAGYIDNGFGATSRQFHEYIRKNTLTPFTNKVMPVLYNAWSTFEFNIDEELLRQQAKRCADIGVELFLIDDGWFANRDNDTCSLGDWYPSPKKFPNGLQPVIDYVNSLGMKFGLWVEPEMVCRDSGLYREHPDWIMYYPTREREEKRHQLTLNLARTEVVDYIIQWLDKLLCENNIECLKWDMNRWFSQAGWPEADVADQKSMTVRYIHGLYRIFSYLNQNFPHVLVENCASGGLRADLSMAKWCTRINRSDNQDPLDILKLHEGFTRVNLSKSAGGGCHLHHTPNYVNGRSVSYRYMAHLAMMGSFAVGLDLRRLSESETEEIKGYIALHKEIRETVQLGDMYLLSSIYDNCYMAVQYVNKDQTKSVLFIFVHSIQFGYVFPRLKLNGLTPDWQYTVEGFKDMTGEGLMTVGLNSGRHFKTADFDSTVIRIEKK